MADNYQVTFTSDEAVFKAEVFDFDIQDGAYVHIGEKNIAKASERTPPFWATFEFADDKDPLLDYLVKASKNPDTFRPQRVEIPVVVKDLNGTIILGGGVIPNPIKQPSAIIELRFDKIEFISS